MTGDEVPRARVRRRRLVRLVWVVPLIAVGIAVWLVYQRIQDLGPEITVTFEDGGGLRAGQTPVLYRGVRVGEVADLSLSEDEKHAVVTIRLQKQAADIAREGTRFWIVRPRASWGSLEGLSTVLSGPLVEVMPGKPGTSRQTKFSGLENPPASVEGGLNIVLRAERPKMRAGAPVYYRGVVVGTVQRLDLASNALSADVHLVIYPRYAALVREGSAFWDVSGVNVEGGLLKGLQVQFDSLRSFVTGGIEFATPPGTKPAKPGSVFFLYEEPKPQWLDWAAKIPIPKEK